MRNEVVRRQAVLVDDDLLTDDQIEAITMGHRVAAMDHGRLEQVGSPLDLFQRPSNSFVAGFMGHPSINMFRGSLSAGPGSRMFLGEGIRLERGMSTLALRRCWLASGLSTWWPWRTPAMEGSWAHVLVRLPLTSWSTLGLSHLPCSQWQIGRR